MTDEERLRRLVRGGDVEAARALLTHAARRGQGGLLEDAARCLREAQELNPLTRLAPRLLADALAANDWEAAHDFALVLRRARAHDAVLAAARGVHQRLMTQRVEARGARFRGAQLRGGHTIAWRGGQPLVLDIERQDTAGAWRSILYSHAPPPGGRRLRDADQVRLWTGGDAAALARAACNLYELVAPLGGGDALLIALNALDWWRAARGQGTRGSGVALLEPRWTELPEAPRALLLTVASAQRERGDHVIPPPAERPAWFWAAPPPPDEGETLRALRAREAVTISYRDADGLHVILGPGAPPLPDAEALGLR